MADESETPEERLKREKYRKNVVKEIVQSETRYVKVLKTLVDLYCDPLLAAINEGNLVITQQVYDSIFQNVKLICGFNEQLLDRLEAMEDDNQVGLIFKQFAPFLRMYTAYTDNSEQAMKVVREELSKESPALLNMMARNTRSSNLAKLGIRMSFKDWCATDGRENNQRLESLLIQPVQRVPRYRMLLAELLKFTSKDNKDYDNIAESLKEVSAAATHCNEGLRGRIREQETFALHQRFPKLEWSSTKTGSQKGKLIGRSILLEDVMLKIDRKGTCRPNVVILFNDLLAYGKGSKGGEVDFSHVLKLSKMTVGNRAEFTDVKKNVTYKYIFQIKSPAKSFALAADTEEMRSKWVSSIRKAITDHTGEASSVTKTAPIWEPDRKDCSICREKFGFFNGKRCHHCRNCGKCVCSSCSPFNVILEWFDKHKPQRVCKKCYPKLQFAERLQRFYQKFDASKLETPGWLDGLVDKNFEREEAFMSEVVARFGPEPETEFSHLRNGGKKAGTASSTSSAASSPRPSPRQSQTRSMTVSKGSGIDNIQALKSMAVELEDDKEVLLSIGLESPSGKHSGGGNQENKGADEASADTGVKDGGEQGLSFGETDENKREALESTEVVETATDGLRWDERLWRFFRYYDPQQLTANSNLVVSILMQCQTEKAREKFMRGLQKKYGPEKDVVEADPEAEVEVAAVVDDSESDADEVEQMLW